MAAILFNAALIYWNMASKQSLDLSESLKLALLYYKVACCNFIKFA
jgi:hypothetical protein